MDSLMASDTLSTATVKLSLLRALKALRICFGYKPRFTLTEASLSIAYEKLKDEDSDLMAEEKALDLQIEEYTGVVRLVDGVGFRQIVEDQLRTP